MDATPVASYFCGGITFPCDNVRKYSVWTMSVVILEGEKCKWAILVIINALPISRIFCSGPAEWVSKTKTDGSRLFETLLC